MNKNRTPPSDTGNETNDAFIAPEQDIQSPQPEMDSSLGSDTTMTSSAVHDPVIINR